MSGLDYIRRQIATGRGETYDPLPSYSVYDPDHDLGMQGPLSEADSLERLVKNQKLLIDAAKLVLSDSTYLDFFDEQLGKLGKS